MTLRRSLTSDNRDYLFPMAEPKKFFKKPATILLMHAPHGHGARFRMFF